MRSIAMLILLAVASCTPQARDERHDGWFALRWVEKPAAHGPSTKCPPEDRTHFLPLTQFDQEQPGTFAARKAVLREGDVIAYWMRRREASEAITRGELNRVGYGILSYGHLAILVEDPSKPGTLRLFSSQSFKGPNTDEDIDTLANHSWDAFRLDQWHRIDQRRFHEFVQLSKKRAGKWYGYDFAGMFGLWNAGLEPTCPEEIGYDYICSTIVVAALHYAGLKLDAVHRDGLLDLVSPKQVVTSKGCIVPLPDATIRVESRKAH